MKILKNLEDIPVLPDKTLALSIGNFDGFHLGHKQIIARLKEKGTSFVLTFSNHPLEVLSGSSPSPILCSTDEKLRLLKEFGVDFVILLEFTPELAQQPYDVFLKKIHQKLPFSYLVLGKGDAFGHKRQGDEIRVKSLESELKFTAEYLPKLEYAGEPISSRRIREALKNNQLKLAENMLGRTYGK
jgi:riboflavin kinase/FMN adenylyltransferase